MLEKLLKKQLAYFAEDSERIKQYLAVGDRPVDDKVDRLQLAALASVANALMNFDEVIMKR